MARIYTPDHLLELCKHIRAAALRTHRDDSCIFTVALLQNALEQYLRHGRSIGLDPGSVPELTPILVEVRAFNRVMLEALGTERLDPPTPAAIEAVRAAGGYMVSIQRIPGKDYSSPLSNGFPGHLVLGCHFRQSGELWIADPSLDQASRLEKNIRLEPMIFQAEDAQSWDEWTGEAVLLSGACGVLVDYKPVREEALRLEALALLEVSPDWRRGQHCKMAGLEALV